MIIAGVSITTPTTTVKKPIVKPSTTDPGGTIASAPISATQSGGYSTYRPPVTPKPTPVAPVVTAPVVKTPTVNISGVGTITDNVLSDGSVTGKDTSGVITSVETGTNNTIFSQSTGPTVTTYKADTPTEATIKTEHQIGDTMEYKGNTVYWDGSKWSLTKPESFSTDGEEDHITKIEGEEKLEKVQDEIKDQQDELQTITSDETEDHITKIEGEDKLEEVQDELQTITSEETEDENTTVVGETEDAGGEEVVDLEGEEEVIDKDLPNFFEDLGVDTSSFMYSWDEDAKAAAEAEYGIEKAKAIQDAIKARADLAQSRAQAINSFYGNEYTSASMIDKFGWSGGSVEDVNMRTAYLQATANANMMNQKDLMLAGFESDLAVAREYANANLIKLSQEKYQSAITNALNLAAITGHYISPEMSEMTANFIANGGLAGDESSPTYQAAINFFRMQGFNTEGDVTEWLDYYNQYSNYSKSVEALLAEESLAKANMSDDTITVISTGEDAVWDDLGLGYIADDGNLYDEDGTTIMVKDYIKFKMIDGVNMTMRRTSETSDEWIGEDGNYYDKDGVLVREGETATDNGDGNSLISIKQDEDTKDYTFTDPNGDTTEVDRSSVLEILEDGITLEQIQDVISGKSWFENNASGDQATYQKIVSFLEENGIQYNSEIDADAAFAGMSDEDFVALLKEVNKGIGNFTTEEFEKLLKTNPNDWKFIEVGDMFIIGDYTKPDFKLGAEDYQKIMDAYWSKIIK